MKKLHIEEADYAHTDLSPQEQVMQNGTESWVGKYTGRGPRGAWLQPQGGCFHASGSEREWRMQEKGLVCRQTHADPFIPLCLWGSSPIPVRYALVHPKKGKREQPTNPAYTHIAAIAVELGR